MLGVSNCKIHLGTELKMFNRILVPLDGSNLAELALPYVEELVRAFNSEVILVSVCEPAESQYRHMHQLYIEKLTELVKSYVKVGSRVKVKQVIIDGEPAEEIINYAEKNEISLIIMTSHGRSGIMPWVMGSVANKVTCRISIPVLLIRARVPYPEKEGLFNKILMPLDGSDVGEAALPYITELTKKVTTEVSLLQVIAPGQHVHTVGGLDYVRFTEQQVEAMKADAKQYLEKVVNKLAGTRGTIRCEVRIGDTAQELIKFADETNTRLVAISTHGRSGIRQWIFGSVAYKILEAGNIPVLLVRAPRVGV